MGIPSYFRHLCQSYPEVIKAWESNTHTIHNLYMDSNSIVYDSMRELEYSAYESDNAFEHALLVKVCETIQEYIAFIQPQTIFICFDGVAPVAKLEQQRQRRWKSAFMANLEARLVSSSSSSHDKAHTSHAWNQTAITPGTTFMTKLNHFVRDYFADMPNVHLSGSDEPGEGEHKLFAFIRAHPEKHAKETTIVYGLDADLIVLCLHHIRYGKLYLYRETPEFVQNFSDLEPNQSYLLDIARLRKAILAEMTGIVQDASQEQMRVNDYLLLTFLLGNDFLPHFPALSLRTRGMDRLMTTYRTLFGRGGDGRGGGRSHTSHGAPQSTHKTLCIQHKDGSIGIHWNTFRTFLHELATHEQQDWIQEYEIRAKWERMALKVDMVDESGKTVRVPISVSSKQQHQHPQHKQHPHPQPLRKQVGLCHLLHIPVKQRECEHYIRPDYIGWERRYYETLLHLRTPSDIRECCISYLKTLEWVLRYYSAPCPDWRWHYAYPYPPLLADLTMYTPAFQQSMIPTTEPNPVNPLVQLMYVLPPSAHSLLPKKLADILSSEAYQSLYPKEAEFQWAFCRYFWECHVLLPEMSIDQLTEIVDNVESFK